MELQKKHRKKLQKVAEEQSQAMLGESSGGGFFSFFAKVCAFLVGSMAFVGFFYFALIISGELR